MPPADAVHRGDERRHRVGPAPVAGTQLVLLGVQVLLVGVAGRLVLEQLVAAVHPVAGHERGGQHEPHQERGRRPVAQRAGQDVGCVRPEVGPHVVGQRAVGDLVDVLAQLPRRGAPREVGVALREAHLGQLGHQLGPREGLGQEDHVGVVALDALDQPGPKRHGLGVRVVDAEHPHALLDPVPQDVAARLPQRGAVGVALGPEVDRVDVLVLLRRVLGVADRAVGPVVEPLGVLAHPRVVGRAVQRVVERHLEADVAGLAHEPAEVVERAQLRGDGRVPTLGGPDGPRAARVVGAGVERVVRALAVGDADGVDGRQVDDVEAHLGHRGQALGRTGEAALAAGEQLVPGAVAGERAVDPERTGHGGDVGVGDARHQLGHPVVEPGVEPDLQRARRAPEGGHGVEHPPASAGPQAPGQRFEDAGALLQLDLDVVAGGSLDLDVVAPGGEPVAPGLDHHLVAADVGGLESALPAVVHDRAERRRAPLGPAGAAPPHPGPEQVVPVAEDVGRDGHPLAHHRLGRELAGRRGRTDGVDRDAAEHGERVRRRAGA